MKASRTIALACVAGVLFFIQDVCLADALPKGEVVSLNGSSRLVLPEALRGKNTLIAFGFHPRHQAALEKGLLLFDGLRTPPAQFQVFEMAVIEPKYKPFKPSVEAFMRKAVKDKRLINRIYPFYTDSDSLKSALNLQKEEFSFVLVGPAGQVLWKKSAQPTPAMVESLRQYLLKNG